MTCADVLAPGFGDPLRRGQHRRLHDGRPSLLGTALTSFTAYSALGGAKVRQASVSCHLSSPLRSAEHMTIPCPLSRGPC